MELDVPECEGSEIIFRCILLIVRDICLK